MPETNFLVKKTLTSSYWNIFSPGPLASFKVFAPIDWPDIFDSLLMDLCGALYLKLKTKYLTINLTPPHTNCCIFNLKVQFT